MNNEGVFSRLKLLNHGVVQRILKQMYLSGKGSKKKGRRPEGKYGLLPKSARVVSEGGLVKGFHSQSGHKILIELSWQKVFVKDEEENGQYLINIQ